MAYYFMIERKKGQYYPLNISTSKYFQTIPRYKKIGAYTLKEIDDFTMMFHDERDLRQHLLEESIIPIQIATKTLSSRYLTDGKYIKVEYDFLYQKDLEYIYDPSRLIKLIMERYYNNEFVLIKKIANYFLKLKECSTTASEVARLAETSIYQGKRHFGFDEIDQNGDTMVPRMLKLIILKHYEKSNGYIDYKNEVNYRNLHDLIAFINNYNSKNQNKSDTSESQLEQLTLYSEVNNNSDKITTTNIQVIPKKRTKSRKSYELEGQTRFEI